MPVHFSKTPPRAAHVPEGGARIIELARTLGLCVGFGRSNATYQVRVYRAGASCMPKGLGTLSVLVAMNDDQVVAHIKARWTQ